MREWRTPTNWWYVFDIPTAPPPLPLPPLPPTARLLSFAQAEKLVMGFEMLDSNGDGVVTQEEALVTQTLINTQKQKVRRRPSPLGPLPSRPPPLSRRLTPPHAASRRLTQQQGTYFTEAEFSEAWEKINPHETPPILDHGKCSVLDMTFSPDMRHIVTCMGDLVVWDLETKQRAPEDVALKSKRTCCFSPDGNFLLASENLYSKDFVLLATSNWKAVRRSRVSYPIKGCQVSGRDRVGEASDRVGMALVALVALAALALALALAAAVVRPKRIVTRALRQPHPTPTRTPTHTHTSSWRARTIK